MTAVQSEIHVALLDAPPDRIGGVRMELNQLWYGPSEVLVARRGAADAPGPSAATDDQVIGAVRLATRARPERPHGLITDLVVDEELRETGLPERLIEAAEGRLRSRGVRKIDGVILDGKGWASYFYRTGYWSSRRTVVLTWDLATRPAVERGETFEVRQVDRPDPTEMARFIVNSYQPYFRWWKEPREDQKWLRVELQPEDLRDQFERASAEVRERVIEQVANAGREAPQTY